MFLVLSSHLTNLNVVSLAVLQQMFYQEYAIKKPERAQTNSSKRKLVRLQQPLATIEKTQ